MSRIKYDAQNLPLIFDKSVGFKGPADAKRPAEDISGVGPKTAAKLRDQAGLPPTHEMSVADFSYLHLDSLDLSPSQRTLLQKRQNELVGRFHVDMYQADPSLTANLRKLAEDNVAEAIAQLQSATPAQDWLSGLVLDVAAATAREYGLSAFSGECSLATAEEIDAAARKGLSLPEGSLAVAVRGGEFTQGRVVVAVDPRSMLKPMVGLTLDDKHEHWLGLQDQPKALGAVVLEYPEGSNKLEALSKEASEVVFGIGALPRDQVAKALPAARAQIANLKSAIASDQDLPGYRREYLAGAVTALENMCDLFEKHSVPNPAAGGEGPASP